MKFATVPRIQRPRLQTSTSQSTRSCACHAKHIVSEPLQIYHACFCNPHKLLRLPRILQSAQIPAPATRKALRTSKNVPSTWCFNDFDFEIALARRRGANFEKTSKSAPNMQRGAFFSQKLLSRAGVVQILLTSWAVDPSQLPLFGPAFANPRSHETMEKHSISHNSYPPKSLMSRICAVKPLCCQTSMLQDLAATFSIVGS